jgi:hypothetical protein
MPEGGHPCRLFFATTLNYVTFNRNERIGVPSARWNRRHFRRRTTHKPFSKQEESTMGLILLIVLIVLLLGGLPRWGYSRNWGYGPSGGLGLLFVVLLVLVVAGYIPHGF